MAERILIAGATGFVGSRLAGALESDGYSVLAMTRHPDAYSGLGKPVFGDVEQPESLRTGLEGADTAYYLVHSLQRNDFVEKDAEAARNFECGGRCRTRADHLSRWSGPR